jgi:transcription antitermination factor NusG
MTVNLEVNDLNAVVALIRNMNNDDLNTVVEAIKDQRSFLASQKSATLRAGDKVRFDRGPRRGGMATGTVLKVNKKTLKVDVQGVKWRVAVGLVAKV